jgi:GTPase
MGSEPKNGKPDNERDLDNLFLEFPQDTRQTIRAAWQALPESVRRDVFTLLPVFPDSPNKWRKLSELARDQFRMAFGHKHKVVIVGPANVGKSTLYNQLVETKADRAAVSAVPGTTRATQTAETGLFAIVDTPGTDAVGTLGDKEREIALNAAVNADFLVIMFDAVQGIKRTEQELFQELAGLERPYIVVLNKMDLARRDGPKVVAHVAESLGLAVEQIVPISAQKGQNLKQLVMAIIKAEPELLVALGQALPAYRWQLAWRAISGAASTAGVVALTPLPLIDFIPLAVLQVSLVMAIARIYHYKITLRRARELAGVLGMGFLGRSLFQQLSKLGGPPGWVVSATVAAATTVVIGYSAVLWFERGERLTQGAFRRIAATVSQHLIESLRQMGRRRPSRRVLSERLREALSGLPLSRQPEQE